MKWPDPFVSYVSQAFSPASRYCSTNKGVFMICWFGLFLAEIRPSKLEEGTDSAAWKYKRKIHNDSSDPVQAFKLHIQHSK